MNFNELTLLASELGGGRDDKILNKFFEDEYENSARLFREREEKSL